MTKDHTSEVAKRDLERLAREGETLGGTAMDTASKSSKKPDDEDSIDKLGQTIGRGMAYLILPVAMWMFGRSAGWW